MRSITQLRDLLLEQQLSHARTVRSALSSSILLTLFRSGGTQVLRELTARSQESANVSLEGSQALSGMMVVVRLTLEIAGCCVLLRS